MKKYLLWSIFIIVIISGCNTNKITGNVVLENKPITIGVQVGLPNALMLIAREKGFFEEQGLNIELVEFTGGKFALQAFLAGSLDMAVSGEVPVTYSSLQGNEYYILAQMVERTINEVRVVARKQEGLDTPTEYFKAKKRKLATSFGGGPEFYTYNFLKKYGIKDVEIISQNPEDMPMALKSGTVDAIAIFDPFAFFAEQKLGEDAITFKDDLLYSELYVLNADREWVEKNPLVVRKLLISLVKSSEFIEKNPQEAISIVARDTKQDRDTVEAI
ncbi:MAG: NrtA/SsuA/CpmA family ABC transporter substrate-binding protein [Nanoarchaeota archaeon]